MDSCQSDSIAVLSIRPEYVKLILSGRKRVEFRRTGFSRSVSHIVVYSTSPERRLVGYFEVEKVTRGTPESLWDDHNGHSGISRDRLFDYFGGLNKVTAITIGLFHRFRQKVTLEDLGIEVPPRSFRYLDRGMLSRLGGFTKPSERRSHTAGGGGEHEGDGVG